MAAHFDWILVQELICRNHRYAKLAGFRKNGLNPAAIGDKVLDFIAVEGEDRSLLTGEERVLDDGKEKAAQGNGLLSKLSLREVHDYPLALVHGVRHREGRTGLSDDVTEMRISSKCRGLVEQRLPHDRLHCV